MKNNELQMPANYAVLNESETSCVKGGGVIAQVFYALGRMFSGVHYDSWKVSLKRWKKLMVQLFPRMVTSTLTLMVLPIQWIMAAVGVLAALVISSTASATCSMHFGCKS